MTFIDRLFRRGSFAEAKPARPVFDEIASTMDGRDITRGYVDTLMLLPTTDSVLLTRGGGDLRIYDEVLRDSQVTSCLQQRALAVASKEWDVDPGDNSRKAKRAADALRDALNRIAWDQTTTKMMFGEFYGYAIAEILWATDGMTITIENIKVRNQRRFGFSPQGELKLLTSAKSEGENLPPGKFWAFSTGCPHDDDPYGLGLAHWLYWPVFFKRNGIKFWLIFLEKFGMPTAIGKYGAGATKEDKDKLLQALAAIQTDGGIRIPESMSIELLEAARSGSADYTALHDRMNAAISKVILGHSGVADSTPGKLGGEDSAMAVREDLIKASADLICQSFNRTVAKWLTAYNDPTAPAPKVWRRVAGEPDQKQMAERDKIIFDMGFKPTLAYISETYAGEWTERSENTPAEAPNDARTSPGEEGNERDPVDSPVAFASPDSPIRRDTGLAGLEMQVDRLTKEADPLIWALLEPVRDLLRNSSNLGEFRDGLAKIYPQMDAKALGKQFAEAFLAAELAGRFDLE